LFGSNCWWGLSGYQPVHSTQFPQHDSLEDSFATHGSRDVDKMHDSKDPTFLSDQELFHPVADEWADETWSDPYGGPQPQDTPTPGFSPRAAGADLSEMLTAAYDDPLPLDLPNMDDVQRNFAKLCERVEAQLDRLDRHWVDDADPSRAQSKKEVYTAGARLQGRLGKSMTEFLKLSGARPKLRRYSTEKDFFGHNRPLEALPPTIRKPSPTASAELTPDDDAGKAMRRAGTQGTRSSAAEDVVYDGRKGRREKNFDQDEGGEKPEKRPRKAKTRRTD